MKIAIKLALLAAALYVAFFLFTTIMGKSWFSYTPGGPSGTADAVVVFFGGFDRDGGINQESYRRFNYSLDLLRQGGARNVIFTGGMRNRGSRMGSRDLAEIAVKNGISAMSVFHDRESYDTVGNLAGARRIMEEQGFRSAILLSSPYHLFRIRLLAGSGDMMTFRYVSYPDSIIPPVTLSGKFSEYNYNALSQLLSLMLPVPAYRYLVARARGE